MKKEEIKLVKTPRNQREWDNLYKILKESGKVLCNSSAINCPIGLHLVHEKISPAEFVSTPSTPSHNVIRAILNSANHTPKRTAQNIYLYGFGTAVAILLPVLIYLVYRLDNLSC